MGLKAIDVAAGVHLVLPSTLPCLEEGLGSVRIVGGGCKGMVTMTMGMCSTRVVDI